MRVKLLAAVVLAACLSLAAGAAPAADDDLGPVAKDLGDAFARGQLLLHLRSIYMNRSFSQGHGNYTLAGGGWVDYLTRPWHGVSFGTSVYTSQPIGVADPDKGGSGLLSDHQDGLTVLGQLWLKADYDEYSLAMGRQMIDTPMMNQDFWAMIPRLFEAVQFKAEPVENLNLTFAHVIAIKTVSDTVFQPMSQAAGIAGSDEPVTFGGGVWRITPAVTVQLWDYWANQFMNEVFCQADGSWKLTPEFTLGLSAQALDQWDVGDAIGGSIRAGMLGAEITLGWRGWVLTGAYTVARDGHDVVNPWGGYPGYTSIIEEDFDRAGEKTWLVQLLYDFKGLGLDGLSAFATYNDGKTPDSGSDASPDENEMDFTVDYYPPWVKGLWLRARYARVDQDQNLGGIDSHDFRLYFNLDLPNLL